MRIIAFRTLREFFEKTEYSDSEISLRAWYHDAKTAEWKNSNELKEQYKNSYLQELTIICLKHCRFILKFIKYFHRLIKTTTN